jgi:cytochrome c553
MKNRHVMTVVAFLGALAASAFAAEAQANWDEHCAKCHGADGKGQTKMGKKLSIADLTDATVQAKFTDEQAFDAMKKGITDKNGKTSMKAIEGLTDDEMKALIPLVRALKK